MFIQDVLFWYLSIVSERSFVWLCNTKIDFDAFHRQVQEAIPYVLCVLLGIGGIVGYRGGEAHRQVLARYAVLPLFIAAGVSASTVSPRLIGLSLLPVPLILHVLSLTGAIRLRAAVLAWALAGSVFLSPVDISFRQYPGEPRFVAVVAGLFGARVFEAAARGEVFPILCPGFSAPEKIWVW